MMDQRVTSYYTKYQLDRYVGTNHMHHFTVHTVAKGENICELARPVTYLHFLVEGRVKVFLPSANARQLLLCFYDPLQLFGDLELVENMPTATTTVEAVTPCVCLSLHRDVVINYLVLDAVFLQQLCVSLGRKLHRVIQNSTLNLLHPLESRIASYILATATLNCDQQLIFSGNVTQIADLLGTSFRHLHRTLQTLCSHGILVKVGTTYVVKQSVELEKRAAGVYVIPETVRSP